MTTESEIQAQIMRAIGSRPDVKLFRNVTAMAWAGKLTRRFPDGSVLIAAARPLHAGLFVGSADLIGWAGPRFFSLEVKSPTGQPTPEQLTWRDNVLRAGGIAGIVRSVEEAEALLR